MIERPAVFGTDRHLVGTLTLPDDRRASDVGFIVLNAGVIHRIGPHRWHVKLARHMAGLGWPAMRFDPSGLGDSGVPRDAAPFKEQAVRDVRAAMDHLSREAGCRRFVVGGICSGAENGFNAALADERVAGVWMVDGHAFPTLKTKIRRYALKLRALPPRDLATVGWRKVGRLLGRGAGGASSAAFNDAAGGAADAPLSAERFAERTQRLVDRGVSLYMLFSGSVIHAYNYAEQWRDTFRGRRFVEVVRCDYRPDIDHTVTTLANQRALTALVGDWSRTLVPPPPRAARPAEEAVAA